MKKLRVGVVGAGYLGRFHAEKYARMDDVELVGVVDIDKSRAEDVAGKFNTKAYSHHQYLFGKVDAVSVVVPTPDHFSVAKDLLENNIDVLIEKPMTASFREASELIEIAEKRNLVLMAGHTYEYHPAVDFLREMVNNGDLGDIYSIDAARLNLGLFRTDVNVLWDLAPHDISIILSIFKETPIAVSARGTRHIDPKTYDIAYLEIMFPSGAMGHVHVSWLHPRKIRQTTIVGSKKMAVYDDVSETEKIHIYDKGLAAPKAYNGNSNGGTNGKFSAWPPNYRYGDVVIPFVSSAEPLKLECSHFTNCITEGKKPRSDGWVGLKVTSILEASEKSLANGGRREKLDLATIAIT